MKKLHRMVTAVKRDGEVGLAYMKGFEREERIRKKGEAKGKTEEIIRLGRRFEKSKDEIVELLKEELGVKEENALEILEMYDK